ncbi:ATP synthase F1 subunit delta [Halothermothrix orenii]|uniref:ATP synthase subunit delta n=1 Tax=Halothermothrix orenii (strain H 168 / OCM 544 / DSM 9562) TaxID=373903 RepID=ATPD_HALOH|nr:ATP synthase F1 subunit delta [Halothermothrix orenii]B8CZ13.1 RecName: Full=ATP synthase subunit delta; AltName: Full=ATP synthase F(1) sector subunit delta; AltName: Full=F-type ATPase subunit delta; Short=F-ATPase subunit delta [Halothermothrix orenii H 168]ACL70532.1 ATP synthase F1, delta subunit [Halothermothrix orenii H 168]
MINNEVSRKYSSALLEVALESDNLSRFKEELEGISKALKQYDDLKKILYHPRVLPDDKKEVIHQVFSDKVSEPVFNFLNLIVDKRREVYLDFIIRDFIKQANRKEGLVKIEVVSAIELSEKQREQLKNKLKKALNKKIELKTKIDPGIIGGIIIKIGDRLIDGSIKHQLDSIKESIEKIPVTELGVIQNES